MNEEEPIAEPGPSYRERVEEYLSRSQLRRRADREAIYGQHTEGLSGHNGGLPPGYESATLQSEISMSVVTDETRFYTDRRLGLLERLTSRRRSDNTDEETMCCGIVNVEPVIMLMAICAGIFATYDSLFMYWARCVELANSTEFQTVAAGENASQICSTITGLNSSLIDIIENDIATTKIYLQISSSIPTLITAPIIGNWADKNGRKPALLFGLTGYVCYSILRLMGTLTYQKTNVYVWYFASEILIGCMGGAGCAFLTTMAIVTDDSRDKLKPGCSTVPIRIGVASFLQIIGSLLGTLGVSLLSVDSKANISEHTMSYIRCGFIQTCIAMIALIYSFLYVRETHFPKREAFGYTEFQNSNLDLSSEAGDDTESGEIRQEQSPATINPRKYGPFKYLASLLEVVTERRPGFTRLCLCLSLFFVFVEFLALDSSLLFLLIKRAPFGWSDQLWTWFSLVKTTIFGVGMIVCPLLLTRVHWLGKDSLLVIIGIASSAVSFFLISQATTTEEIFITAIMGLLIGGISPGYRSFLPRLVSKEQTARLFTILAVIMSFCPILSSAIFNNIFEWSMDFWAGFAFFIGGILQLVVVIGQITIHILMREQWRMEKVLREHRKNEVLTDIDDITEERQRTVEADPEQRSVSNTTVMGSDIQPSQETGSSTPQISSLKA